jgi:two-component system sensor histidine kinase KdpD
VVLLPDHPASETLVVRGAYPPEDEMDDADLAAARWCWQSNRPAGRGADTLPGARRLFLPLRTARGPVAVVGIDRDAPGPLLSPDQSRLLDALGDQAAVSIERVSLAEDLDRSRLNAETERLRTALLTSISHDLRTPLSTILGAAGTLQSYHDTLDAAARAELLGSIAEEAERLNRFVANLLDMTGAVTLRPEPTDVGEVIGSTLARAAKVLSGHRVALDVAADVPLLPLDAMLLEQVLFNLLDNAARYTPTGSAVTLRGWRDRQEVRIQVIDEGPGIALDLTERIFEKFYRAPEATHQADHRRAGTGLGLAICRGFVEAMGGRITAANRADRSGAVFTIALPVAPA